MRAPWRTLTLLLAIPALAVADDEKSGPIGIGDEVPGFELPDHMGETHDLEKYLEDGNVVVLEWFNPDCPAVGHYHLRSSLAVDTWALYNDQPVVWLAVNSGAPGKQGYGVERNKKFVEDNELPYAVLMDPAGTVGRTMGATNTPHLMVVAPDGTLAYRGGYDDALIKRSGGDCGFLKQALDEVLEGKEVSMPETKSPGCTVKYAPKTSGA